MSSTCLYSPHKLQIIMPTLFALITMLASTQSLAQQPTAWGIQPEFHTFSIVALDPDTGETGVAVTSRVPCVGNAVTWVRPGVGAVATQGRTRLEYGNDLFDLLELGIDPQSAMDRVVAADADSQHRQVGVIDIKGRTAQWTGMQQYRAVEQGDHVAMRSGTNYAVQGNALVSTQVVEAVADTFEQSQGKQRHLADRLIEALYAGQMIGGDFRHGTKQGAAVLVADPRSGMTFRPDQVSVDISVCENPHPVLEMRRIYDTISQTLGYRELRQYKGLDVLQLKVILHALSYYRPDGVVSLVDPTLTVYDAEAIDAVNRFRSDQKMSTAAPGFIDAETIERLWNKLEEVGLDIKVREDLKNIVRVNR
jgi:uncharacterized Ntn-hydrolase superfamily protein